MMWIKSCPRCKLGDMTLDEDDERVKIEGTLDRDGEITVTSRKDAGRTPASPNS